MKFILKILFIVVGFIAFNKAHADCKSAYSREFCDWRKWCRWTSRGCVIGPNKPDEKETSILNNFGLSEIELPARDEGAKD